MSQTRRDFLKSTGLVALGLNAPLFVSRTAALAAPAHKPGARDTILVVVELNGGNDGLNTVIPFKNPLYAKYRPTLQQSTSQIKKLTDEIGLHPQLTDFADLHQEGHLCVVQGVGYPNPDQSHFRSMDIWQSASKVDNPTEGWIGKALRQIPGAPSFHLKNSGERAPLALDGAPARVPSIASLQDFQLQVAGGTDAKAQREVIEGSAKPGGTRKPGLLDFVQRTASNTYASSRRLQEIGKNYQPKATYPQTQLANKLKLAAQLIDGNFGARIFYVSLGGFDTHAQQAGAHANLMQQLSGAVAAFFKDLSARGHKDRLLVMTFSEFGRRAKENGSKGTDHGSAAPMFLIGGKVKPGLVGAHPSLEKIPMGNLEHHTDFRQVYAAVLDQWLGVSSKDVLGGAFKPVGVFRS
ncbi:MAG: DUF1501 domain-containing protein [Planctomycetes bacterium]|nr:DUF1501 domain-containing protein [Planctomycetota bacterium]